MSDLKVVFPFRENPLLYYTRKFGFDLYGKIKSLKDEFYFLAIKPETFNDLNGVIKIGDIFSFPEDKKDYVFCHATFTNEKFYCGVITMEEFDQVPLSDIPSGSNTQSTGY
jgi:hypothetical protein